MDNTSKTARFHIVICYIAFYLVFQATAYPQASELSEPMPLALKTGFEKGDAGRISGFFNETLSVELQNQAGIFNKNQVEMMLQEFFLKNPVDNYTVKRSGITGVAGDVYFIGEILSGSVHFRVYLICIKVNNLHNIHSLSITRI